MSTFQFYGRALTTLGMLAMALSSPIQTNAQNTVPRVATVMRLEGKARYSSDNQTWQTVKHGSLLGAGVLIQTADNAVVDLRLDDSTTSPKEHPSVAVRIAANTVLAIDQLSSEAATGGGSATIVELDLRAGQITGDAGQPVAGSRYEIKFPGGLAGIRSGLYRMKSSGMVDALNGEAVVAIMNAGSAPVTKTVTAGHRLDPGNWNIIEIPANSANANSISKSQPNSQPGTSANPLKKGPGLGGSLRQF